MKFRSNYYTKTHWKKTKFDYKKFHLHHKKYSDSSNLSSNLTHIMGFAGIATDSFVNLQAKGILASKHRGSKCASIGAGSWLTPIKISLKLKLTHCSFFFLQNWKQDSWKGDRRCSSMGWTWLPTVVTSNEESQRPPTLPTTHTFPHQQAR